MHKVGSKKAGQKWTELSEKLNCFGLFRDMPRDQRSVRERGNKLLKDYKNKKNKDEQANGIKPDSPTENETLLEQRAKKVVFDSPRLVDFAIRLVNSVLNLLEGRVKFFGKFKLQKYCNQCSCL